MGSLPYRSHGHRPPLCVPQVDKGTGADTERLKLKLTLEVEGIEFDAEGGSGVVVGLRRVGGVNHERQWQAPRSRREHMGLAAVCQRGTWPGGLRAGRRWSAGRCKGARSVAWNGALNSAGGQRDTGERRCDAEGT